MHNTFSRTFEERKHWKYSYSFCQQSNYYHVRHVFEHCKFASQDIYINIKVVFTRVGSNILCRQRVLNSSTGQAVFGVLPTLVPTTFYGFYMLGRKEYRILVQDRLSLVFFPHLYSLLPIITRMVFTC
jgi:hypothetical protein